MGLLGGISAITRRYSTADYKLSPMTFRRGCAKALLPLIVVASCKGTDESSRSDSTATLPPVTPAASAAVNPGWDTSVAGPVMLLSVSENVSQVAIVLPLMTDSTLSTVPLFSLDSLSGLPVDLFAPGGTVSSTSLLVTSQRSGSEGCLLWPEGRLAEAPGRPWRTGFRKGIAMSLPFDSIEAMTPADSSRITAEIARLASARTEGADSAFRGLPFSVRKAYRFSFGTTSVLVSDVVRKISEEANPREERTLLVAERLSSGDGKYVAAFHSRAAGAEEVVRTHEILGAVRLTRTGTAAVVLIFGYEDGARVALLERTGDRRWAVKWRSAYTGC